MLGERAGRWVVEAPRVGLHVGATDVDLGPLLEVLLRAGHLVLEVAQRIEDVVDFVKKVRVEMRKPDGGWAQLLDELGAPVDDTSTSVWLKQRRSRENHYVAVWQPWRTLSGHFRIVIGRKQGVVVSKEFEL